MFFSCLCWVSPDPLTRPCFAFSVSLTFSPLFWPILCLAALIWPSSAVQCVFLGILSLTCSQVFSSSVHCKCVFFFKLPPLQINVTPVPSYSDLPNAKWNLSQLHVHTLTHTHCLCSFIKDRDLFNTCTPQSHLWGVQVFLALLSHLESIGAAKVVVPHLTFSPSVCTLNITFAEAGMIHSYIMKGNYLWFSLNTKHQQLPNKTGDNSKMQQT